MSENAKCRAKNVNLVGNHEKEEDLVLCLIWFDSLEVCCVVSEEMMLIGVWCFVFVNSKRAATKTG